MDGAAAAPEIKTTLTIVKFTMFFFSLLKYHVFLDTFAFNDCRDFTNEIVNETKHPRRKRFFRTFYFAQNENVFIFVSLKKKRLEKKIYQ